MKKNWGLVIKIGFTVITLAFVCVEFFTSWLDLTDAVDTSHPLAFWALLALGGLAVYLTVAHWLPGTIWIKLEKFDYLTLAPEPLRTKLAGSLGTVATLAGFSIVFVVLIIEVFAESRDKLEAPELHVLGVAAFFFLIGVVSFLVTLEAYDTAVNPALTTSRQIKKIYTRIWWCYTGGVYCAIFALFFGAYFIAPLLTIVGVPLFVILFTMYLYTRDDRPDPVAMAPAGLTSPIPPAPPSGPPPPP